MGGVMFSSILTLISKEIANFAHRNEIFMAQIDEFFFDTNRVEGITEADYERVKPYVEAAQAAGSTAT